MVPVEQNQIASENNAVDMSVIGSMEHSAQTPLLDMESVKRLQSLNSEKDPDFFARLVEAFQTFGQKNVSQMNNALHNGEWLAVSRFAHALKGSCANFGAANTVELCADLEKKAAAQDLSEVPRLVARITNEFTLISHMLKSMSGGGLKN